MSRFVTAEPIPPGEYLRDEIDARGWTHADLAEVLDMSRRQVVNLITGTSAVTPETAIALAQAFDQDAETWMHLQVSYELARAARKERDIEKRAAVYNKVPVREMVRRGWIDEHKDPTLLSEAVCRFLRIPSISHDPERKWAARKSGSYKVDNGAQIAWHSRAKQLAECVSVPKYSPRNFARTVAQLRQLMANRHDVRRVPRVLAGAGIRFVIVQHLKGSKVDGASFWLGDSPTIAVTLRYDRIDNFWFTLMHELAHVKYRDESLDVALMETDDATLPEIERRANKDAAEYLVPQDKLESFIRRCGRLYYQRRLVEFANWQQVHPGIVVGQLHWRRELKHSQFRRLLEKVKNEIVGQALTDGWGDCPATGVE